MDHETHRLLSHARETKPRPSLSDLQRRVATDLAAGSPASYVDTCDAELARLLCAWAIEAGLSAQVTCTNLRPFSPPYPVLHTVVIVNA